MIRGVLFDCDGVLVDSEPIAFDLLAEDFSAHGLTMPRDEMHRVFVGGTMEKVAQTARDMGAGLSEDWVAGFYERLYARLAAGTPLIEDVPEVLSRLDAANILYAVGSNGTTRKMMTTLGQHPEVLAKVKDQLYSGQELGCPKPDPGLYLAAAKGLGLAPEDCVVIDDSPAGCRGGVAAGIRTLGFAEHGSGADLAATGAEVFHRMRDLPALIGLQP